ncbi:MAG: DUF1320 domain-containing protein [Sneathiellaceae bacterium]
MGTYVTKAAMIELYTEQDLVRLTDTANVPPTTIDDDRLDRAIADAESQADTYLRARYSLPLAEVPAVLTRQVGAVVWWYLKGPNRAGEDERQAYEDALKWFEQVATGRALLVESDGDQVAGRADVQIAGPDRIMTAETLQGF